LRATVDYAGNAAHRTLSSNIASMIDLASRAWLVD
jgi:hypothetical protein